MPFETLNARLQQVANAALAQCKTRFGQQGLKVGQALHNDIPWQPTFSLKESATKVIAVEVDDRIYPEILKIAAYDVSRADIPICVYQACSLEAYQIDPKHARVNMLKKNGFGIITVDDDNHVEVQHAAIPLAQFISADEIDKSLSGLTPKMKVAFRNAHSTYLTNEGQGLQQAGQIVEALVKSLAQCAEKDGLLTVGSKSVADLLDELYAIAKFHKHRAALGGTRDFAKDFRNAASHPATTAKAAADKIRRCRAGFFDAMKYAKKLREVAQREGYALKLFVS